MHPALPSKVDTCSSLEVLMEPALKGDGVRRPVGGDIDWRISRQSGLGARMEESKPRRLPACRRAEKPKLPPAVRPERGEF